MGRRAGEDLKGRGRGLGGSALLREPSKDISQGPFSFSVASAFGGGFYHPE